MTDRVELKKRIRGSGMSQMDFAAKVGMAKTTLHRKLNGGAAFTVPEVETISECLGLSARDRDRIFFAHSVSPTQQ